jgi:virginiamycin B lyase
VLASDGPELITDGGDGNVWYTGNTGNDIGYQSETTATSGDVPVPTASSKPFGIAANVVPSSGSYSGNKVYFTENAVSRYGTVWVSTTSSSTSYRDADAVLAAGAKPAQVVVDSIRGNVWFAQPGKSGVQKAASKRGCSLFVCLGDFYATPTANAGPTGLAVDLDGNLWFTETNVDKVGELNLITGVITEYKMPSTGDGLQGIAMAPDGSMWITESKTGRLARLVY